MCRYYIYVKQLELSKIYNRKQNELLFDWVVFNRSSLFYTALLYIHVYIYIYVLLVLMIKWIIIITQYFITTTIQLNVLHQFEFHLVSLFFYLFYEILISIYSIIWWVQLYDEYKYIFALWHVHYIIHFGMMTVLQYVIDSCWLHDICIFHGQVTFIHDWFDLGILRSGNWSVYMEPLQ